MINNKFLKNLYICLGVAFIVFLLSCLTYKDEVQCKDYHCTITYNKLFYKKIYSVDLEFDPYVARRRYGGNNWRTRGAYMVYPFVDLRYHSHDMAERDAKLIINGNGSIIRYHIVSNVITLALSATLIVFYIKFAIMFI